MPARIFPTRSTIGRTATRRPTSPIRRKPLRTPVPTPVRRVCMPEIVNLTTHRRGFLGRIAAGAAALGLGGLVAPLEAAGEPRSARAVPANPEFEAWLNKITGKHKMVFDIPEPNGGFGFAWARVFLNTTNENYGTTDADNTVAIVLRHNGIAFGIQSPMWAKYKFGEFFKLNDGVKKEAAPHYRRLRDLASNRRISRYSQISVTIRPNAPYHSMYLGAPPATPVSMKSKSRIRFSAATTTMMPLTTRLAVLFPWRNGIATWNQDRTHPPR